MIFFLCGESAHKANFVGVVLFHPSKMLPYHAEHVFLNTQKKHTFNASIVKV